MPKTDPFANFAEKMLSGPKVSDSTVPEVEASPAPVHGAAKPEKKSALADHKAFTVYIHNDLLQKIRTANYKSCVSAKAIINEALVEYFEHHPELL